MTPESPRSPAVDLPHLPDPRPPSDALAILRWAIAALKASRGPARTAIRRYHAAARGGESGSSNESLATVANAIATDLAMSVAKAFAAALTGPDLRSTSRADQPDLRGWRRSGQGICVRDPR